MSAVLSHDMILMYIICDRMKRMKKIMINKNSYDVNNNGSMSLSELAKLVAHLLQVVGQSFVTDFRFLIC